MIHYFGAMEFSPDDNHRRRVCRRAVTKQRLRRGCVLCCWR